jgi:hypothetical protein
MLNLVDGINETFMKLDLFMLYLHYYKITLFKWNIEQPPTKTLQPQGYMALPWIIN